MVELVIYKEERQNLGAIAFIKNTQSQIKIKDITSEEDIKHQLTKSMVLISTLAGIKDPIAEIVKIDIKEMILSRFKALSFDEVSYAFKLERYGELNPRTDHFQLFDASYVSKILHKYKKWKVEKKKAHNISNEKKDKEMEEEEKDKIMKDAIERMQKQFYFDNKIYGRCHHIYDYLNKKGLLPTDRGYKLKVFEEARIKAKEIVEMKKKYTREEHTQFKEEIKNVELGKGTLIVNTAKKIVLEDYFKQQKA